MKQIIIITLWLASAATSFSQTKEASVKKFYLGIAGGSSSQKGSVAQFDIQLLLKNNWTTSFSYYNIDMETKDLPANYKRGYTELIFIFPIYDSYPSSKMN